MKGGVIINSKGDPGPLRAIVTEEKCVFILDVHVMGRIHM